MFTLETDDGKYKFINDNGAVTIYRYGELWDTGNKATLSLLQYIEKHLSQNYAQKGVNENDNC